MPTGWRTKQQLLQLHNSDSDLVDNIIASKVSLGHFRPHPDAPEDPSATMYYVPGHNCTIYRVIELPSALVRMHLALIGWHVGFPLVCCSICMLQQSARAIHDKTTQTSLVSHVHV